MSLILPKIIERKESEKVMARNTIALSIPRFITSAIGLKLLLTKTSFIYKVRNRKVKKAIISFKVLRRNESLE